MQYVYIESGEIMTTLTGTKYFRGCVLREYTFDDYDNPQNARHALRAFVREIGLNPDDLELIYLDNEYPSMDEIYHLCNKNYCFEFIIKTPY